MCQQNRGKSQREPKCNKQQHQGDTGYNIGVEHRDIGDAHEEGSQFRFHRPACRWLAAVPMTVAISADKKCDDQRSV